MRLAGQSGGGFTRRKAKEKKTQSLRFSDGKKLARNEFLKSNKWTQSGEDETTGILKLLLDQEHTELIYTCTLQ